MIQTVTSSSDEPNAAESSDETAPERRCATCDDVIDTSEWHPAAAVYEDDELAMYAFCSQECREAWEASDE